MENLRSAKGHSGLGIEPDEDMKDLGFGDQMPWIYRWGPHGGRDPLRFLWHIQ